MQNISEIEELIKLISKLPGLGPKSAKSTKIYKDVIKNFPDAELTDVHLNEEDEPND